MRSAARLAIPTEDLPDGPDDRPGPEGTVVAYIEAERARALLARLPRHQRELLGLRVLSGSPPRKPGTRWACRPGRDRAGQAPGAGPAAGVVREESWHSQRGRAALPRRSAPPVCADRGPPGAAGISAPRGRDPAALTGQRWSIWCPAAAVVAPGWREYSP